MTAIHRSSCVRAPGPCGARYRGARLARMRALAPLAFVLAACGSSTPPPAPSRPAPVVRTSATDSETRRMILDLALDNACDLLQNAFLPLQDPRGIQGKAAGNEPVIGRWWIQRCKSQRVH